MFFRGFKFKLNLARGFLPLTSLTPSPLPPCVQCCKCPRRGKASRQQCPWKRWRVRSESIAIGATAASNAHLPLGGCFEKDPALGKYWATVLGAKQPKGNIIVLIVAKLRDIPCVLLSKAQGYWLGGERWRRRRRRWWWRRRRWYASSGT